MLRVQTVFTGSAGAPYYSADFYGGSTEGEALAATNATQEFWFQLANILDGAMTATIQGEVHQIDPATGLTTQVYQHPDQVIDFSGSGEVLPRATQGLLRYRTGDFVAGRELRGRKFIPGVLESSTTDGRPSAPLLALFTTAWNASRADATAAGGQSVYSLTHKVAAQISLMQPWSEFAILRSRRQ